MASQRYTNLVLTVIAFLLFAHLVVRHAEPAWAESDGPVDVRLVSIDQTRAAPWDPIKIKNGHENIFVMVKNISAIPVKTNRY